MLHVWTWLRPWAEMKVRWPTLGLSTASTWWRHQMKTFFALQRPVTQSFDVSCGLRLNKQLSKQSRCWWFGMPLCSLWRHCNDYCSLTPPSTKIASTWWWHDMETLPALLALCEGNQLVTGGFHSQRASNTGSVSTSYDHHVDAIFIEGGISQQWCFFYFC